MDAPLDRRPVPLPRSTAPASLRGLGTAFAPMFGVRLKPLHPFGGSSLPRPERRGQVHPDQASDEPPPPDARRDLRGWPMYLRRDPLREKSLIGDPAEAINTYERLPVGAPAVTGRMYGLSRAEAARRGRAPELRRSPRRPQTVVGITMGMRSMSSRIAADPRPAVLFLASRSNGSTRLSVVRSPCGGPLTERGTTISLVAHLDVASALPRSGSSTRIPRSAGHSRRAGARTLTPETSLERSSCTTSGPEGRAPISGSVLPLLAVPSQRSGTTPAIRGG